MALSETRKRERSEYPEDTANLKITDFSTDKPYVFVSYASGD